MEKQNCTDQKCTTTKWLVRDDVVSGTLSQRLSVLLASKRQLVAHSHSHTSRQLVPGRSVLEAQVNRGHQARTVPSGPIVPRSSDLVRSGNCPSSNIPLSNP